MYKGDFFYHYMKNILADKGIYYFSDLVSDVPEDRNNPKYRWKLKIIASDISNGRMLVLPNDAKLYGIEPDELEVALAVRMSMSIPLFFKPVKLDRSYIVDGGMLSNFPIWIFDADSAPDWPTFGFLLKENDFGVPHNIHDLTSYLGANIQTMMNAHDRRFVRPEDYLHRTIAIPTSSVSGTDFNMGDDVKNYLFHSGYRATIEFLDNWSFTKYVEWARKTRGM